MTSCYPFTLSLWKRAKSFEKESKSTKETMLGKRDNRQSVKTLHRKKKKKKKLHREFKTEVRRLSREVPTHETAGENSC